MGLEKKLRCRFCWSLRFVRELWSMNSTTEASHLEQGAQAFPLSYPKSLTVGCPQMGTAVTGRDLPSISTWNSFPGQEQLTLTAVTARGTGPGKGWDQQCLQYWATTIHAQGAVLVRNINGRLDPTSIALVSSRVPTSGPGEPQEFHPITGFPLRIISVPAGRTLEGNSASCNRGGFRWENENIIYLALGSH